MTRLGLALLVYAVLWGLVVEGFDAAGGDPFDIEDMVTHAFTVGLAVALWPLWKRLWRPD